MFTIRVLENITGYIINIDDINYYKDEEGNYDYDRLVIQTPNALRYGLENITGYIISIGDVNYYKDEDGLYDYNYPT